MVGIVKSFIKTAVERRRLYLDYSCYLADTETLSDFQTIVRPGTPDAPLTLNLSYPDAAHKRMMMYVSGGLPTTNYTIQVIVTTNQAQVKRSDLGMRVVP